METSKRCVGKKRKNENILEWGKNWIDFCKSGLGMKKKKTNNDKVSRPRRDLNSRPLVYKTSALTTELRMPDEETLLFIATYSLQFF